MRTLQNVALTLSIRVTPRIDCRSTKHIARQKGHSNATAVLTIAQDIVKVNRQTPQDNLRCKVFLEMRRLVPQVVVLREGTAEVWDSNHGLKLIETRQGQAQL